ncbi:hypothetical protein L7F22_034388 [Adiantum nelumboides]|nr:hypothetical protein [Adiantum nelumboides]
MKDVEKSLQKWPISCNTLCNLLLECMKERDLDNGRRVHTLMSCVGHDTLSFGGDRLIRFFASCGCLTEADIVFGQVLAPSVFTWNSIISAHVKLGDARTAIHMYFRMQKEGMEPDKVTFSCILKACSVAADLCAGRIIHSQVLSNRIVVDLAIGNALVDMYAKCGSLEDAQQIFDELPTKDVITWGAIIGGHASQGNGSLALDCYHKMHQREVEVNDIVLLCVIKACCNSGLLTQGKLVHHNIIFTGLDSDVALGSALIDMFIQCRALEEARKVFEKLAIKNVVAWGAMIGGYAQQELGCIVLELFARMQQEGVAPNIVILLHVMKACGSLGTSTEGKVLHHQVLDTTFVSDILLGSATVDMYARCGDLNDAQKVFDMLAQKSVVTWGALVSGYARQGSCKMLEACLKDAQQHGFQLDDLIFTALLTACCHAGLVEQGCIYFMSMMEEYGIEPSMEQYSCLVHLLGSGGCLVEAEDVLQTMPISPEIGVWRSMLSSSRAHAHTVLGGWCLDQATRLENVDAAPYILLSNAYVEAQMFDSVEDMLNLRKFSAAKKTPGKALIEVGSKSHEFIVGGMDPLREDVISKVNSLNRLLKEEGFVPLSGLVLNLFAANQ